MELIDELGDIGQKQPIAITTDDGTTVEGHVAQSIYEPGQKLRLEISAGEDDGYQRYQVKADADEGDWSTPHVRGRQTGENDWTDLGTVEDLEVETGHRTNRGDMDVQGETDPDVEE
ncbi:hypothetical protein [Halomicrobium salinisoli]|uniref:hypothetical protein n=1 Tax=Halomicrobium salinisoli TaxID=2878391 RepID=UPI001CEFE650|nr:hypothetical protein [Halomicrobium salinisoli]